MASTLNLVRNSRVFFTTNVNTNTGVVNATGNTTANTFELQVLDGFSFTQGTTQTTIQVMEASNTPTRGQRAFNTALNPVDFSFSTYIRPNGTGPINCEEQYLWNALLSANTADTTGLSVPTVTAFVRGSTTTNIATFTCASIDLGAAGIANGDVVTVGTVTGTAADQWNAPAIITVTTGTINAATGITLTYQAAPSVAAGTTATNSGSIKLFRGGISVHPATTGIGAKLLAHTGTSNKNQLQKFGMIFVVDNAVYVVDNCALDQVSIDFGLDTIATSAWTGKGTALRLLPTATLTGAKFTAPTFGGTGLAGTALAAIQGANFITNKLSTLTLQGAIMGGGTTYTIALTGGNLTYANNINYITPTNLGIVNAPVTYYTGTRSITGNVTAYLRTGTGNSAQVLSDMLTANQSETKFKLQLEMGGASNAVHVDFLINGAMLQVPTVATADLMTTTINFNAQGYDPLLANAAYDFSQTNDLTISYYSA